MLNYLIKSPTIINENKIFIADVLLENKKISKIQQNISHIKSGTKIINAEGLHLLPGMIDDQVHFREPGLTHKADIESESKAAVCGGITSYMDMPNCIPSTTSILELNKKKRLAAKKSHTNYAFYLGATSNNLDEIRRLSPGDACGVKIFMGSSTGNMLVNDIKALETIFLNSPILIATHCEDNDIIAQNEKRYENVYGSDIPFNFHPLIRSREACIKSSKLAVKLAKKFNAKLNILHITTKDELALFDKNKNIPLSKKRITAEACVHHLFFSQEDYKKYGSLIKCNPSIKTEQDRLALLEAINDDIIDIIATDHAPHKLTEKFQDYFNSPAGLPLIQYALLSLFQHYHEGRLSLEKIVQKTAHAPAIIYQIQERGFIREGYWADLVLVNLHANNYITNDLVKSKCGWTPFCGSAFSTKIIKTFVNGILKYDEGSIISKESGMCLDFLKF